MSATQMVLELLVVAGVPAVLLAGIVGAIVLSVRDLWRRRG